MLDQETPSPPRFDPLVTTDIVISPPALYPPKQPPRIAITNKINQRIMEELKNNQPYHQHKNGTHLATRRVTRFTCSGVNNPSYGSQESKCLEACDRTIIEMTNAVTDPLTGSQMEYVDLIKDPKLRENWTSSMANKLGRLS